MVILSKGCKLDNFESYNSLKLCFMNIQGLCQNFVDYETFLESNTHDIIAQSETSLDESIDTGNFSVRGCLPLIRHDSTTHVHGIALLHAVSYFFFLYQSPSLSLRIFFYSISSKIDQALSINPSAVFVFGDSNIHHKNQLTYFGGNDRPDELCYNFSISNNLTQMVNSPFSLSCTFGLISFF